MYIDRGWVIAYRCYCHSSCTHHLLVNGAALSYIYTYTCKKMKQTYMYINNNSYIYICICISTKPCVYILRATPTAETALVGLEPSRQVYAQKLYIYKYIRVYIYMYNEHIDVYIYIYIYMCMYYTPNQSDFTSQACIGGYVYIYIYMEKQTVEIFEKCSTPLFPYAYIYIYIHKILCVHTEGNTCR